MNTLTLIMGTPNAGKTTYSQRFYSPIHFDDYQTRRKKDKSAYEACNEEVASRDGDVCVEGVYNRINQRLALLDAVKEKNLYKVCIWLDTPTDKCIQRERAYRKRPEIIVRHQASRLEPPTYDEGWDEIRHVVWASKY